MLLGEDAPHMIVGDDPQLSVSSNPHTSSSTAPPSDPVGCTFWLARRCLQWSTASKVDAVDCDVAPSRASWHAKDTAESREGEEFSVGDFVVIDIMEVSPPSYESRYPGGSVCDREGQTVAGDNVEEDTSELSDGVFFSVLMS
mmetsp:Transcript_17257/g.46734  ORF Transcript_17257/g.46734 Transcript_17257/m.46734 type:complete len:143 (+) Transcript_17257:1148-1576(+)